MSDEAERWWQRDPPKSGTRADEWADGVRRAREFEALRASIKGPTPAGGTDAAASPSPAPDEIEIVPPGYRYSMLAVSLVKRMLATDAKLRPMERLQWLEQLTDEGGVLSADQVAAIEPLDDVGLQMLHAGMSLDLHKEKPPHNASFNMLTRGDVFRHFVRLNPSLLEAARLMPGARVSGVPIS